ncbi:MAG TPA: helix-turn-helix domain-containing protein [Flavobacterium sp.]|uniref:helix-turn-helix domain-containing protein n=1 Tax=unclassified Flavobacterium TaxID=196869 RepID=UPI000E84424A|nr:MULTISPECIES: helix-turn-helix domain-containing protein [unclassified Flavobacterium]HBI00104.1 transcriptional regulator [Flavobacterium sp.]HRE77775.1 helix-turn-helix domain-containing protein [Flavobacterium sp.]
MNTAEKTGHIGRKISKIRELRGMKQEALAQALGISQQSVSVIENSEEVEQAMLERIATALEVSVEGIKRFTEEAVFNYFNTFNESDFSHSNGAFGSSNTYNFNPIEKLIEAYEENKKLYERLLEAEKEKVTLLEQLKK